MDIIIVVATHKKYQMPEEDMYMPIQVGKAIKKDDLYEGDNTGDNISAKNPNYCELTAMYWAWKNLKADYLGLAHYRRHFCNNDHFLGIRRGTLKKVLSFEKASELLKKYDAILPQKRHYWIETIMSHYEHTHKIDDLLKTREVISRIQPDYLPSFDKVMKRRSAHMFNMFVMKQNIFHDYSDWLFSILFQLEKEIDLTSYSPYEARVFGYISEILFDVWLDKHQINCIELPVMFMDKQNWAKKIYKFIRNKFSSSELKQVDNEGEIKRVRAADIR